MSSYKELLAQRVLLEKEIEEARQAELADAIARAKQLIADHGLTAADLGFKLAGGLAGMAGAKLRVPVAVKFRGPRGETWSGRGKPPNWLKNLEAQGQGRETFLVSQ
jgi:DNA-binding protein H-NS